MIMHLVLCLLAIVLFANAKESYVKESYVSTKCEAEEANLANAFSNYSITPCIIPTAPAAELYVRYFTIVIHLGTVISPFDTLLPPYVTYDANPTDLYTLIYFNPDLFYRYSRSCDLVFLNFLTVNIPGNNINAGDQLSPYVSQLPIPGTGYLRGIFLLYRQRRRIVVTTELIMSASTNIPRFNLTAFVTTNRLRDLVAGNFFLTRLELCGSDCGCELTNEKKSCPCSCS